jgi:hypothetical protein
MNLGGHTALSQPKACNYYRYFRILNFAQSTRDSFSIAVLMDIDLRHSFFLFYINAH